MKKVDLVKKALKLELGTEEDLGAKTVKELTKMVGDKEAELEKAKGGDKTSATPEGKELYEIKSPKDFVSEKEILKGTARLRLSQPISMLIGGVIKQSGDRVYLSPEEVTRYGAKNFKKL